jgi:hypothetical protein
MLLREVQAQRANSPVDIAKSNYRLKNPGYVDGKEEA